MGGEAGLRSPTLALAGPSLPSSLRPQSLLQLLADLGPLSWLAQGPAEHRCFFSDWGAVLIGLGLEPERVVCELGVPQWGMLGERLGAFPQFSCSPPLPPNCGVIGVVTHASSSGSGAPSQAPFGISGPFILSHLWGVKRKTESEAFQSLPDGRLTASPPSERLDPRQLFLGPRLPELSAQPARGAMAAVGCPPLPGMPSPARAPSLSSSQAPASPGQQTSSESAYLGKSLEIYTKGAFNAPSGYLQLSVQRA